MKALFYTGTMQSEIRETDEPSAADGEVIVKISHCGICGSDMHAWHGQDARRVPPMILGHEAVGIAEGGIHKGKRVAINPLMTCGTCRHCMSGDDHLCADRELIGMRKAGAYAERVAIAERNVYTLPDALDFKDAALAEPLAVCIHAVEVARKTLRRPVSESRSIVLGGGAIGLLSALVLADQGCKQLSIVEANPTRRKTLENAIDAMVLDPAQLDGADAGDHDLVIDAVGTARTRTSASAIVAPGGTIVHIGLQEDSDGLDTRYFTLQEITFAGTYCYTRHDFAAAVELLTRGIFEGRDWIELRPLDDGAQSFVDIHEGNAPPKIILEMSS